MSHEPGERLSLVEPELRFEDSFRSMVEEMRAAAGDDYANYLHLLELYGIGPDDFPTLVRRLREFGRGIDLPPPLVPAYTYWLVRDDRDILGESRLRMALTDGLLHEGGHIGYHIRPSERRRGYGTRILALTKEKARAHGIERVLLTCDTSNIGSARIIEKNGGVLESEVVSRRTGRRVSRYWIDLR